MSRGGGRLQQVKYKSLITRSGIKPNLLAALSWVAGAVTTLSIAGGFARATSTTTGPARIIKGPFTVNAGRTYTFSGTAYQRTAASNMFVRVSTTTDISTGDVFQGTTGGTTLNLTGLTFVPAATGPVYFGIVPVVVTQGEYGEIDDNVTIREV